MTFQDLIPVIYLITAVTFILGLKGLSGPTTAVGGNRIAAAGMIVAVAATFATKEYGSYGSGGLALTIGGMAVGAVMGVAGGRLVKMTAMPQMVAIFNGCGGGAAALVSILEYTHEAQSGAPLAWGAVLSSVLGLMIGGVSFSGSAIAYAKLQGVISARAYRYPGQRLITGVVFVAMILLAAWLVLGAAGLVAHARLLVLVALAVTALLAGLALVLPIGGADMPVVISLLNAFTGLAVAMAGFVLSNQLLIVAGTLVGASGTILTRLMSKAMNRSIANVLFAGFGAGAGAAVGACEGDTRTQRAISAEDAAILLGYAQSVIIVPGYGLAVAQAQHAVRELADMLEAKGASVRYAIHPVAGRMPGHMNVLLAEANVPYEKLYDMDQINEDFKNTDVALVIGANDVTNPAARADKSSPIYGMPILNVDQARNVIVIKRSMRSGFAGIENELYLDPKTGMLFGDAKKAVEQVIAELKKAG
ncbi:MAG: NAD(P)(+) transhydrogenase (Re/Si-specific) subunit beta [Chloroflexi bacterium]|nr:NAD(P)(+) transhydrogenase (Re/Si-specific) subunit beta [Chloroflexota bacterium]